MTCCCRLDPLTPGLVRQPSKKRNAKPTSSEFVGSNFIPPCRALTHRITSFTNCGKPWKTLVCPLFRILDKMVWAPGYQDRKSTRLNSSHVSTSYAVFC